MNSNLLDWAKKQGLATLLVLLGVGIFTGYIPSPLKTTAEVLAAHAVQMDQLLQESRYQTALLATLCFKIATPSECLTNLLKEHTANDLQAEARQDDPHAH
jgi:hypothetical protein